MTHRPSRRALSALALMTSLALGGALVSGTAAGAATTGPVELPVAARPAPPPDSVTPAPGAGNLHWQPASRRGRLGADLADSINCTLNVQYPHASSHVGGTVNDIATVTCNAPISALQTTLALYYWSGSTWVLANFSSNGNFGQASLTTQVAAACVSGIWVGEATAYGVAPPGYYPPTASDTEVSPEVSISC
jgi:hypothetical protein